jgi:hypothetical protein
MRVRLVLVAAVAISPMTARAQATDSLNLQGRSTITLGIGLTSAHDASASGTGVASEKSSWELGSLAFHHWVRPQLAVLAEIDALSTENVASPTGSHSYSVDPILVGLRLSPRALAITPGLRPYASVAAGAYIHTMDDASIGGTASSTSEAAPGARLALGTEWFATRHFVIGIEGAYHAIGKFDHPDAVTDKAGGLGIALAMGFAWGGR